MLTRGAPTLRIISPSHITGLEAQQQGLAYIDRVRLKHQTLKHQSSNLYVLTKVPHCMEAT